MAVNLGPAPAALSGPGEGTIVLGTHPGREGEAVAGRIALRGDEGVVVRLRT